MCERLYWVRDLMTNSLKKNIILKFGVRAMLKLKEVAMANIMCFHLT